MKKHCIPDGRRHPARLKFTPIALACATLALPAVDALAQAAAPSQTVVVTGIRRAIESSIAIKRNSDQIVEAISAEDIGKLPDNSIAESLARLPGLTAQRVDGRDQVITIRGMAPKFAVTLLNGRQLVSTGDNRSVEYDQFPSELMNGAQWPRPGRYRGPGHRQAAGQPGPPPELQCPHGIQFQWRTGLGF
jgi:iron complex outermembrane receptor protein